MIDLLMHVTRVSVETQEIVEAIAQTRALTTAGSRPDANGFAT